MTSDELKNLSDSGAGRRHISVKPMTTNDSCFAGNRSRIKKLLEIPEMLMKFLLAVVASLLILNSGVAQETLKSPASSTQVKVWWVSQTPSPVEVAWVDFEGKTSTTPQTLGGDSPYLFEGISYTGHVYKVSSNGRAYDFIMPPSVGELIQTTF